MKYLTFLLIMFSFALSAQESNAPRYEKEGDLTKVVFFHDNGEIAQTGYFKDKKLHGNWISYHDSGKKTAMGSYQMGMKNGQWFFWKGNELIEVIYKDNKIINVLEWNNSDKKMIAKNN